MVYAAQGILLDDGRKYEVGKQGSLPDGAVCDAISVYHNQWNVIYHIGKKRHIEVFDYSAVVKENLKIHIGK